MPRTSRNWISEEVKDLQESDLVPFHEILDPEMVKSALEAEPFHDYLSREIEQ